MKSELTYYVQERILSKNVKDFDEVVKAFGSVYHDLTSEIKSIEGSNVKIDDLDEGKKIIFNILEYDLTLSKKGKIVSVFKGDANKDEEIGQIHFKNGYSFIQFFDENGIVEVDYYLSNKSINKLFELVFDPLLRETS